MIKMTKEEALSRIIFDLYSALATIEAIGEVGPENLHEAQVQRYSAAAIEIAKEATKSAEEKIRRLKESIAMEKT